MFELALPWVFLLLPLPWLVWYLLPPVREPLSSALRVPFFDVLQPFIESNTGLARQSKTALFILVWLLLLCALAGPRWVGKPQSLTREGYNVMLALDISGSMEINDMVVHGRPVTRLSVVKRAAEQFVKDRVGDRIGLILFGSRAYLQTPLTYDRQNVLLRIEDATAGLAGKTTSIGDALGLAVKRLQQVPAKGRLIVLLTDGVNNSGVLPPLKSAELARADGIKVYTIGLGSSVDPQTLNGLFLSMNGASDLDEDTLKEVAEMTGGQYFRATDLNSLSRIYQEINRLETVSQQQATVRPQKEYYPYPLAGALLLLWFGLFPFSKVLFAFRGKLRKEALL